MRGGRLRAKNSESVSGVFLNLLIFPGLSQPYCGAQNHYTHFFGGKKTNKHKQIRGIVPEMGGGQIVYVLPFFLGKKGNT